MPGSAMELKNWLAKDCYSKIKKHFAQKDWEIVAFNTEWFVLRIERENVKFNRSTGRILERVDLGVKR